MPHHYSLSLDTLTIPLLLRQNRRAKRMILRYSGLKGVATLTLPPRVPVHTALSFAESRKGWLQRQILKTPERIPFEGGTVLPIAGKDYRIVHAPQMRGVMTLEEEMLRVPGQKEFLARRVRDWLKNHAKQRLTETTHAKAAEINVSIRSISVRDMRSRWGSCQRKGNLSFSWRLILAPPEVLDYLVCHEVAHLKELNHSQRFWKVVAELCPEWRNYEKWLKKYGNELYRYG